MSIPKQKVTESQTGRAGQGGEKAYAIQVSFKDTILPTTIALLIILGVPEVRRVETITIQAGRMLPEIVLWPIQAG